MQHSQPVSSSGPPSHQSSFLTCRRLTGCEESPSSWFFGITLPSSSDNSRIFRSTISMGDAWPVLANESRRLDRSGSLFRHQRIPYHVDSDSRKRRSRFLIGVLAETCVKDSSTRRSVFSSLIGPHKARRSTEYASALRRMAMVCLLSRQYSHCHIWMAAIGCHDSVESGNRRTILSSLAFSCPNVQRTSCLVGGVLD